MSDGENDNAGQVGASTYSPSGAITVVLGALDALVSYGVERILREDDAKEFELLATEVDDFALEVVLVEQAPRVALLAEPSIGSSTLERLRAAQPATDYVAVTHRPTRALGLRLLAAGASCISTNTSPLDLLATVRRAAAGKPSVVPATYQTSYPPDASLTPREIDVLEYLVTGESYGEIAAALHVSPETVRTHSTNIRRKLNVRSKRQLIGLMVPEHIRA